MDAFCNFMSGDTAVYRFTVHNWLIALAGVVLIRGTVLPKDL